MSVVVDIIVIRSFAPSKIIARAIRNVPGCNDEDDDDMELVPFSLRRGTGLCMLVHVLL
jgi:hypothetical protein